MPGRRWPAGHSFFANLFSSSINLITKLICLIHEEEELMTKRMIQMLMVSAIVIAGLGFFKFQQFQTMAHAASNRHRKRLRPLSRSKRHGRQRSQRSDQWRR